VFSYSARRRLSEHAYQMTRADLRRRAKALEPILARHGIKLDRAVLADKSRTLIRPTGKVRRERAGGLGRAARQLDRTLDDLGALLRVQSM
jgi:NTE family protein